MADLAELLLRRDADEPVVEPATPVEPEPILDTRTPAANYATRNNIVADGPGTVAEHL